MKHLLPVMLLFTCSLLANGQTHHPPQAPPIAPDRKVMTTSAGRTVPFIKTDMGWRPEEPGWHYDIVAQCWVRGNPNPRLVAQPMMQRPVFFSSGGRMGFGGMRGAGC